MVPNASEIIDDCRRKGQLVEGPFIEAFEQEFARVLDSGYVKTCSTEYGRTALYFILKALDLPKGSEIICPALTFWVVPEITRVAGLVPVFADVDPYTFTIDPAAIEKAITPNTRAILPTHLYGLPCDMDPIMALAKKHNLKVIEDCAHSLGATYKGQMTGTFGDASFFSFQAFKPLNTFGGGLAWTRDADLMKKVAAMADAEERPSEKRVEGILRAGLWQNFAIRPAGFTFTLFPIWWTASWIGAKPEEKLWEKVRSLDPLPMHYRGKFSNVQAALGYAGLKNLPNFIDRTRQHAKFFDQMLGDIPGVTIPSIPEGRTHVYYQYCPYIPNHTNFVAGCIRRGVDAAPMHVDHCTEMPLFGWKGVASPGAAKAMTAVQIPVYESLTDAQVERVGKLARAQAQNAAKQ